VEYHYFKKYKIRLTNAYIVRQKDGPYCTDLHFQKIKKALPEVIIRQIKGNLVFIYPDNLFLDETMNLDGMNDFIKEILVKYNTLTNSQIKTTVYLTDPMRRFLKLEKEEKINLYNVPIQFN
jgi:hypothetical protein